jgi:hypothetical protein
VLNIPSSPFKPQHLFIPKYVDLSKVKSLSSPPVRIAPSSDRGFFAFHSPSPRPPPRYRWNFPGVEAIDRSGAETSPGEVSKPLIRLVPRIRGISLSDDDQPSSCLACGLRVRFWLGSSLPSLDNGPLVWSIRPARGVLSRSMLTLAAQSDPVERPHGRSADTMYEETLAASQEVAS